MELRLQDIKTPFFNIPEFVLKPGQRLLIQGSSGSGKTTFLHLLAGLYKPQQGQVLWEDEDVCKQFEKKNSQIRRRKMSLVFQNLNLLSYLTATENIELCGCSHQVAHDCLQKVGLLNKAGVRTQQLSLGEQQRIAVARVLAQNPEVILADEPTSSLDDVNAHKVISLLLSNPSQSLCVVSHDHRILDYFDKIIAVKDLLK